ncbi:pentapeptide repeat-containing protein [Paenibacillus hodogayensis]|uniref:Pentapeptide repeat-containing protein n=1 Tax=Paenibacillus hodogayensis TaxID=279208 RepID=A0ABV5W9A1_9BACL
MTKTIKRLKIYRLNSFKTTKIGRSYSYLYFCKSRSFQVNFNNAKFKNVNFRGAILTKCFFKKASFDGVDFLGTNLRKGNFEGATFRNCIFVGALLEGCNFRSAKFENVIFVNTSFEDVKHLNLGTGVTILTAYPKVTVSDELQDALNALIENKNVFTFRVLHLSTTKLNHLNLKLLLDKFPEHKLVRGLRRLKDRNEKFLTFKCVEDYLRAYLQM